MKSNLLVIVLAGMLCPLLVPASRAQNAAARSSANSVRGPREIIAQTIQTEVGRALTNAGAAYDALKVTVAVDRDSATPFKVEYRGLRNFSPVSGSVPPSDGDFVMEYIGAGKWQGQLGGKQFTVAVGRTDNIDLPFVDDPQVIGEWVSVDFVPDIAEFNPDKPVWTGKLYLTDLVFMADGKMSKPWLTWTKGRVLHRGDQTASRYELRDIGGQSYLFFEWRSGDVTVSGMKPHYYVLRKKPAQ